MVSLKYVTKFSTFISSLLVMSLFLSDNSLGYKDKYATLLFQNLNSSEGNGIGKTISSYSIGARAINNNPAGISMIKDPELYIGSCYLKNTDIILIKEYRGEMTWKDFAKFDVVPHEVQFVNFAFPIRRVGNLGFGFAFGHEGRFIRVNKEGKAINSFPRTDMSLGICYGTPIFKELFFGINLKRLQSKIDNTVGSAYAVDLGMVQNVGSRARYNIVLQNLAKDLSFKSAEMPKKIRREFVMGANYTIKESGQSKFHIGFDLVPFKGGIGYNVGGELLYHGFLSIRLGYTKNEGRYDIPLVRLQDGSIIKEDDRTWTIEGLTFGVGLRFKGVEVSFAQTPYQKPVLKRGEKIRFEGNSRLTSLSIFAKL